MNTNDTAGKGKKPAEQGNKLHFIFTKNGFRLEASKSDLSPELSQWQRQFTDAPYRALYQLGFEEKVDGLDAAGHFLHRVAVCFLRLLTERSELELTRERTKVELTDEALRQLENGIPYALGTEYIDAKWLQRLMDRLGAVFAEDISKYDGKVSLYLTEKNQKLRVAERIFFHLVESKDEDYPFAFLATYATKGERGKVRHVPLKYALMEYQNEREKLLGLLACLNRAAEACQLIGSFVESGEMFHTLKLTADEAYTILKAIPQIEQSGILCRIPNWWKHRSSSVSMSVSLGDEKPAMLGFDTLVSMKPKLVVDGVPLSEEDIRQLLGQTEGLALLKGKWVEVDHARLEKLLQQMEEYSGNISLLDALQGGGLPRPSEQDGSAASDVDLGTVVTNGAWLSELLHNLRVPSGIRSVIVPKTFQASLRPYQKVGYTWLNYMSRLGFGACLADDMGLGKTVQLLAFLEKLRVTDRKARVLLVVPASLLGNWQRETQRFAPDMDYCLLHGKSAAVLGKQVAEKPAFLTITTYGMAQRIKELEEITWSCIVLDEAQAIKNPATKTTRQIKKLSGKMRIAMTGTPIENELTNLWSLFDFLNKGLLGSSVEFRDFCSNLDERPEGYAHLKGMVSPFMLRRVKSDKRIISDLPEKWEKVDYVGLSKKQVVLYRKVVTELEQRLGELEGMERRGVVLAAIMKLKQICNHPDQYLGQQAFVPEESGKFQMLREICETIYEKRERVLVFTQFKELTEYLAQYLSEIFNEKGFVLHGGTPVAKRSQIVEAFQGEDYVPFVVLSVKAGGIGLNLTGANHVIHFDRWWNPAVENQATDRAYRIGQTKNVMVHKLVCEGTIEEKIDEMLNSKKELAEQVVGSGGESWITEMGDEALLSLLKLS